MFAQADFSRSDLARGRESDVINRCQSILTLGNPNAEALTAKYNVSASDLKALKNSITAFSDGQPKPRQGRAASVSATSELAGLFAKLDETLNKQLDPLMVKCRFNNPVSYNEYETARAIVNSAASHEMKEPEALLKAA